MKLLPGAAPNCCETSHAMLVRPGETMPWCAFPDNGTDFTHAELQEALGGDIEVLPLAGMPTNIALLIVNQDGHRLGLALNDAATFLAGQRTVGPALMCPRELLGTNARTIQRCVQRLADLEDTGQNRGRRTS